ncbi:hypothetical protein NA56DRAFT_725641 [Hyaloscypha hepaticicola]|uniref:Uncharacterized protein n=1 Tax=Hyaloscypha hepaticicola TaxID=2082293 RepID=A0A2J6PY06_9HELO|nr:hypothetical protein NA56DRAFT_725641 [Hyaloscypha hepaticicola]
MSPQGPGRKHFQCCGIQVTFFEQCGHTSTEEDHHPACTYLQTSSTSNTPQAGSRLPRSLAPSNSSNSESQPFPQPYPKCGDLHRYINLMDAKCPSCYKPPRIGHWNPKISSFRTTWSPLTQNEIFERGVYWLNEMLLAREEAYQGALADWEANMQALRDIEDTFQVPELERVYGYDPSGVRGDFLGKVRREGKGKKRGGCGPCKDEMGNVMRWFAERKNCPGCGVEFKLVKSPRREDQKLHCWITVAKKGVIKWAVQGLRRPASDSVSDPVLAMDDAGSEE